MTDTPRCTATSSRTGEQCQKQPMKGATVCRNHGGATPQVRQAAARRLLEARVNGDLAQRGWEPVTDPLTAYADLAGEVWALKELCREKLAEVTAWDYRNEKGDEDSRAAVQVYERSLDRCEKQLASMLRLGLDAAALRQSKERPSREQAQVFAEALQHAVLVAGLDAGQQQRLTSALLARLGVGS